MITVLNALGEKIGNLKNVLDAKRSEELNGEYTLDLEVILNDRVSEQITTESMFEDDGNLFDVSTYESRLNEDGFYVASIGAEHVSYRLNNEEYNIEPGVEFKGTIREVFEQILEPTPFSVGILDIVDVGAATAIVRDEYTATLMPGNCTITVESKMSTRALIVDFVESVLNIFLDLGGELSFNGWFINVLTRRGTSDVQTVVPDRNIKVITKTVDKRKRNKNGTPMISYTVQPIYLPESPYVLGDDILVLNRTLKMREVLRVLRVEINPYDESDVVLKFGNLTRTLTDVVRETQRESGSGRGDGSTLNITNAWSPGTTITGNFSVAVSGSFSIEKSDTIALFTFVAHATITTPGEVDMELVHNSNAIKTWSQVVENGKNVLSIPNFPLENPSLGGHTLLVRVRSTAARGSILGGDGYLNVFGVGVGAVVPWDGTLTFNQPLPKFKSTFLEDVAMMIGVQDELVSVSTIAPVDLTIPVELPMFVSSFLSDVAMLETLDYMPVDGDMIITYIDDLHVDVSFINPVYGGTGAGVIPWMISGVFGGEYKSLNPTEIFRSGVNSYELTLDPAQDMSTMIRPTSLQIVYTASLGGLKSHINNATILDASSILIIDSSMIPKLRVTFDPTGGEVAPTSTRLSAAGKMLVTPIPILVYNSFIGWFTEEEGGTQVDGNTVFTENTIVYAHWYSFNTWEKLDDVVWDDIKALSWGELQSWRPKRRELVSPIMTSNTTPSPFVITTSSQYSAAYAGWNAFNGLFSPDAPLNGWATGNNTFSTSTGLGTGILTIDMGVPTLVNAYSVWNRYNPLVTNTLGDYTFQGSADGLNWEILHTIVDRPIGLAGQEFSYIIPNTNEYRYYRIYITKIGNRAESYAAIGKIELYEEVYL